MRRGGDLGHLQYTSHFYLSPIEDPILAKVGSLFDSAIFSPLKDSVLLAQACSQWPRETQRSQNIPHWFLEHLGMKSLVCYEWSPQSCILCDNPCFTCLSLLTGDQGQHTYGDLAAMSGEETSPTGPGSSRSGHRSRGHASITSGQSMGPHEDEACTPVGVHLLLPFCHLPFPSFQP
jgi:hypothetical protein